MMDKIWKILNRTLYQEASLGEVYLYIAAARISVYRNTLGGRLGVGPRRYTREAGNFENFQKMSYENDNNLLFQPSF